jgi:uncharacterized protein YegJ (DUF2314 family)
MKRFIITTCTLLVFGSGLGLAQGEPAPQQASHLAGRENKSPGAPGYQQIADDDKQFARAAEHAQRSLGFFMAALQAKKGGDNGFEVKRCFIDGDKCEHLWINHVSYDGKKFHGTIDNRPLDVKNVHLGERVSLTPQQVSDWMFVKDGRLIGGYTTRILYARLSPAQRAEFDQQADFKIEEKIK